MKTCVPYNASQASKNLKCFLQICFPWPSQVNKPYLPLAAGEFTMQSALAIVTICGISALIIGVLVGSLPLMTTLVGSAVLSLAYSVDLPFLRWKRYPVAAATCILAVRYSWLPSFNSMNIICWWFSLLQGRRQLKPQNQHEHFISPWEGGPGNGWEEQQDSPSQIKYRSALPWTACWVCCSGYQFFKYKLQYRRHWVTIGTSSRGATVSSWPCCIDLLHTACNEPMAQSDWYLCSTFLSISEVGALKPAKSMRIFTKTHA